MALVARKENVSVLKRAKRSMCVFVLQHFADFWWILMRKTFNVYCLKCKLGAEEQPVWSEGPCYPVWNPCHVIMVSLQLDHEAL